MLRKTATRARHVVLWFRNDLRVHDNALFSHPSVSNAERVTPVYIFDPRHFQMTEWGSRKSGHFRARFLTESVVDLRNNLRRIGSDLSIFHARPEDVLGKIAGRDALVLCQEEVTSEELHVDAMVEKKIAGLGSSLVKIWGTSLYHPEDLPFEIEDLPEPFTKMRNKVERKTQVRKLLPTPTRLPSPAAVAGALEDVPDLRALGFSADEAKTEIDARGVLNFKGGETAGLERVRTWTESSLKTYKSTRNGLMGSTYSSKYSPWLALGCLSPRRIYWDTQDYENRSGGQTVHTYWLIFELLWRDFMRFYCAKHGNTVFRLGGPRNVKREWDRDQKKIEAWRMGRTGVPWVDASMRELLHTGYMSNRGRQNVASFLCHELKLDWRYGADHFESLLLDHDVCSNYGNWVFAAGLCGGRLNRFNMLKQAHDYDKTGEFVKYWCPELKAIPAPQVHTPWTLDTAKQQEYGCVVGQDYPAPIISVRTNWNRSGKGDKKGSRKRNGKGRAKGFKGKGRVHRGRNGNEFITY